MMKLSVEFRYRASGESSAFSISSGVIEDSWVAYTTAHSDVEYCSPPPP